MNFIRNHQKYILIVAGILLALVVLVFGVFWILHRHKKVVSTQTKSVSKQVQAPKPAEQSDHVRLIATGDFIFHDAINLRAKKADGTYDYLSMMSQMQPFFSKSDVRFCNQATPAGGAQFGISGYPIFNAPLDAVDAMAKLGCNVINTGTNHTFDKGQGPISAELDEWDKQTGILAVAGANRSSEEQQKIHYFEVGGIKFAFLAYTTYTNADAQPTNTFGVNRFSEALAKPQVIEARSKADVVIVSMRWGTEYSGQINTEQTIDAQKLSDWGADIILGHGPHVLQPVKKLMSASTNRDTYVWYSLGNFLNAQLPIESLTGCLGVMDIQKDTKTLSSISCLPLYMHYEWTAAQKAKEDLLSRTNFQLVPLDKAADLLAKSQDNTNVTVQTNRIKTIIGTYTEVSILASDSF